MPVKGIYLITDRLLSGDREAEAVKAACRAGVRMVQYREKEMGFEKKLEVAKKLRMICNEHGAEFFVNDDVEVALLCRADGVHLGQGDLGGLEKAREGGLMVGVSARNLEEAGHAREIADYVGFGPVFRTGTKKDAGKPTGIKELAKAVKACSVPVYAIGGVSIENIGGVMETGAMGAAVISAVMAADDFYYASKKLVERVNEWI